MGNDDDGEVREEVRLLSVMMTGARASTAVYAAGGDLLQTPWVSRAPLASSHQAGRQEMTSWRRSRKQPW